MAIDGVEQLWATADTIAPEAACTSVQLHLQVSPASFAVYWNAAQAVAGVQLAVGANSPYLFGKELWRETRIALFEQATDTRSDELKEQGVRPRVWFGERWITSIFDLFEENVRYFPALLPICQDEDPVEVLQRGDTPELAELRLHNGTVYRWNRPVYDYGLVRVLAEDERPIWSRMSFHTAEENFHSAARHRFAARLFWPDIGEVSATDLVLRQLLPTADTAWAQALRGRGVAAALSSPARSSKGNSTRASTRLAMNLAVRTGVPVRVTSVTSTMPRP